MLSSGTKFFFGFGFSITFSSLPINFLPDIVWVVFVATSALSFGKKEEVEWKDVCSSLKKDSCGGGCGGGGSKGGYGGLLSREKLLKFGDLGGGGGGGGINGKLLLSFERSLLSLDLSSKSVTSGAHYKTLLRTFFFPMSTSRMRMPITDFASTNALNP